MSGIFGSSSSSSATAANSLGDLQKDVQLTSPPEDSISDLCFSPQSDHLAVASWDKKVRIYEVKSTGGTEGKALYEHEAPALSVHWSKDGTKVVSGGADKAARMLDVNSGSTTATQVAAHDQPIRVVRFIDIPNSNGPILATGSWDKTVKYWDLRASQPIATLQCQERVYTMDVREKLMVIGTADRYINVVNLNNPQTFYKTLQSPLKWQTRVVSCFADSSGFAVGSIEGRCAIQYVEEKDQASVAPTPAAARAAGLLNRNFATSESALPPSSASSSSPFPNTAQRANFSFKCHRDSPPNQRDISNVFSVNAISFHPVHGTFSTAGSDGTFHFWDKDAKHRLKGFPQVGGTISATNFNRNGSIFAYAVSYDWSKGYASNTPQYPNKVMLHAVTGDEAKPRGKKK